MSSNGVKSDAFLYDCPDNYVFLDAIKFFLKLTQYQENFKLKHHFINLFLSLVFMFKCGNNYLAQADCIYFSFVNLMLLFF